MLNILIVDDDETSLRLLSALIGSLIEAKITTATNGVEALAIIEQKFHCFDAIFSDIVMPEMGGMELVYQIYTRSLAPNTLLVGMSAVAAEELLAIQTGMADVTWFHEWLAKPFDHSYIDNILSNHFSFE